MKVFLFCMMAFSLFGMSLEEKVGQMLMVHFHGEEINDDARRLIDQAHAGGFIFYNWSNGELTKDRVKALCHDLQSYSPTPLFLTVDQEGGRVQRLKNGFTRLPRPALMDRPFEWGGIIGKELTAVGINLNLAPVVEPYLEDRTMSWSAKAFIDGMHMHGLGCCIKHYPGYGKGTIDAHFGLPVVDALEPFPFYDSEMVMTAHVLARHVDPNYCATLSKRWVDRLRQAYDGVVITDSLTMDGVWKNAGGLKQAVFLAARAGADILLIGIRITTGDDRVICDDLLDIHAHLVDCVRKGILSEAQIDKSVSRIMKLKKKMVLGYG